MILEDVNLVELEQDNDSSPYFFRTRIMDIITDKGKFSTPARVITRTEQVARSNAGISKTLPKELEIDFRILLDSQVRDFQNDSKVVQNLVRMTKQFNDYTRKAIFRISIFQPAQNSLNNLSNKEKINFAELQADFLQIRLGSNLITYPFLDLSSSEYIDFIKTHYKRDHNFSTLFVLDLAMEPTTLKKILDYFVKMEEPIIIPIIYRDWTKTAAQHAIIASYFNNRKIAFFSCQTPREIQAGANSISNLHSISIGTGFDLVSLEQPRGFGKANLNLNRIKFFSPKTFHIDNIMTTMSQSDRELVEEFELNEFNKNDRDYLNSVFAGYRGALVHPKKFDILLYIAKMHEALTSSKEFDKIRETIQKKETEEFIINSDLKNVPLIRSKRI